MRRRLGLFLVLGGLALAVVAALMVMAVSNNARKAAAEIKQVQVVMARTEVPQGTAITQDMLETTAFPAEFVPEGAITGPAEAVGKFTVSNLTPQQIITAPLLSTTKRAGRLALNIPKGKVALAVPKTDLLSANDAIQAGDYVDVLVTFKVKMVTRLGVDNNSQEQPTTQKVLQNILVLDVLSGGEGNASSSSGTPAVALLLDHQQAMVVKLAKDSGSSLELALRGADDDHKEVATDGETIDSQMVKNKFRKPQPVR